MIVAKKALPRRTFLRGMGVTVALPLLDAMVPALFAMTPAGNPGRRFGFVYIPMGMNPAPWIHKAVGKINELSTFLASLITVIVLKTVITNFILNMANYVCIY